MKNISSDNEPVVSNNDKIKCPPEGKLMSALRRVLVVFSLLQGLRRAIQFASHLAKVIKELLDHS